MGEIAALGNAFDSEFSKALSSLRACPVTEHDAFLNHHRNAQRIVELVAHYGSKLPPYASVQRFLACAERLVQRHEHQLARDACFAYIRAMGLDQQSKEVQRIDAQARLSFHAQACMGVDACEAALALGADAHMKHPSTLAAVVACLERLRAIVASLLPVEAVSKPCRVKPGGRDLFKFEGLHGVLASCVG